MPLKLRILVNLGTFASTLFFNPKTFSEDVIMSMVFSVNYLKFGKLFICSF